MSLTVPSIIGNEVIKDFSRTVSYDVTTAAAHGFVNTDVGKLIYMNGSTWTLADSSAEASFATHIIESITGTTSMRICSEGTVSADNFFARGTLLYVGSIVPGEITTTVTNQKFGIAESSAYLFMRLQNNDIDSNVTYAKGDLITHNGSTSQVLNVGTDGQFLLTASGQSNGLQWTTLANTVEAGQKFTQGSFGSGAVLMITPAPVLSSLFSPSISVYEEQASALTTANNTWVMSPDVFETTDYKDSRGIVSFNSTSGSALATLFTGTWTAADVGRMIVAKDIHGNVAGKALIANVPSSGLAEVTIKQTLTNTSFENYQINDMEFNSGVNGNQIRLSGLPYTPANLVVACTKDSAAIDTTNWTAISSFNNTAQDNSETMYLAIGLVYSNDDEKFWITDGANPREILRKLSGGAYNYNSDIVYGSSTFTPTTSTDRLGALSEALAVVANQMTGVTLNASGAPSLPVINGAPAATSMLFMVAMSTSDSAVTPEFTLVNFSYNANASWRKNNSLKVLMVNTSTVLIESDPFDTLKNICVYITD
jgi:hypothetical protein